MSPSLDLHFGAVTDKSIVTPNDFVSHMVEHIAWRLGCSIHLNWLSEDWGALGRFLGAKVAAFPLQKTEAAALGMIDDGSAEVSVKKSTSPKSTIKAIPTHDLPWFLGLRCEQLSSGKPLVDLLQGFAEGAGLEINVLVCALEDAHHTWEGVYRSLGIALSRMYMPPSSGGVPVSAIPTSHDGTQPIVVLAKDLNYAHVRRGTAESGVEIEIDFGQRFENSFACEVADSIDVRGVEPLLSKLATAAGFSVRGKFRATKLSSSHVVWEDTGLVLGRALLEILVGRMNEVGVNGAGSTVKTAADQAGPLGVGISVEGRKFWKYVPFTDPYDAFRKAFLVGHDAGQGARSEDLDDFIDGLAGGLAASLMIHVRRTIDPAQGWPMIFEDLGTALAEVFAPNPFRKGVPPGVKATLA